MPYLHRSLHGYQGGDGTSEEAAAKASNTSKARRNAIVAFLGLYPGGLTADEIAEVLGLSVLAIRPRVTELRNMGLIEPTGERRRNASGMSASVLTLRVDA